ERSRHAKLRGTRHPPRFFRVDVLARVVINDFARDLDFQTRWIERLDAANARLTALEPLPKFREASQRRHRAHSCDNHPFPAIACEFHAHRPSVSSPLAGAVM